MNMSENFTRRSIRVTTDALRVFASEYGINMGIDDSDNRPNVIKYVFYHTMSGKGTVIIIDFMQVEYLDKCIDTVIERLMEKFVLEG